MDTLARRAAVRHVAVFLGRPYVEVLGEAESVGRGNSPEREDAIRARLDACGYPG